MTVDVSGLVTFDNIDLLEGQPSDLPESMYMRDLPDEIVKLLLRAIVTNDKAALLSFPWHTSSTLEAYARDSYRGAL